MEGGGRGKEVRIKDKAGIERRETCFFFFRMRLKVDYPNFAATGMKNITGKKINHTRNAPISPKLLPCVFDQKCSTNKEQKLIFVNNTLMGLHGYWKRAPPHHGGHKPS